MKQRHTHVQGDAVDSLAVADWIVSGGTNTRRGCCGRIHETPLSFLTGFPAQSLRILSAAYHEYGTSGLAGCHANIGGKRALELELLDGHT